MFYDTLLVDSLLGIEGSVYICDVTRTLFPLSLDSRDFIHIKTFCRDYVGFYGDVVTSKKRSFKTSGLDVTTWAIRDNYT